MKLLLLVATAAVTLGAGWMVYRETHPVLQLVDELDRIVQGRFAAPLDDRFGISRTTHTTPQGLSYQPGAREDRRLLRKMSRAGVEGTLLVASRTLTTIRPDVPRMSPPPEAPRVRLARLGPPALFRTKNRVPQPTAAELAPEVEKAVASFRSQSSYEFNSRQWHITARPLRAVRAECLGCHQAPPGTPALKVGDVLGVAMYAFAPVSPPGDPDPDRPEGALRAGGSGGGGRRGDPDPGRAAR